MVEFIIPALVFVLMVAALVDIITKPEGSIQHLPKIIWIFLVIILPLVGGVIWFVVGRTYESRGGNGGGRYAEPFHRGDPVVLHQQVTTARVSTTEQELADLDREIEYYEKRATLDRLKQQDDGSPTVP